MGLEHILLGLLREPASGYDLKAIFDERLHYFWAAELSQIYPALQGLERKGLLRSRQAPSKRGPGRRIYQITMAGHRTLRQWLESGPELHNERMDYLAKIYLMDELDDLEKTLQFILQLRDEFSKRLAELQTIERYWSERDPTYPDSLSPQMFHVLLALRKGVHSLSALVKWCDESVRRVQARLEKENHHGRTISRAPLDSHRHRQHGVGRVLDSGIRKKGRPRSR
jgi:PadR family transcriptional regulator, phenolic acid-responsive transcriptional regulator